ncbi:MAG: hydrogenase maturation nickel metallochaperone HypA [Burkholderiales bacterium]|nr:hydrogenase maturation nickel metallochaperone HypA [Burkholderiales bacterium]
MHESSLTDSLVRAALDLARAEGARRIAAVRVRIGALAQISPAHLREHFEHSALGTIAEGAQLLVRVADDIDDPNAQGVVLEGVSIES